MKISLTIILLLLFQQALAKDYLSETNPAAFYDEFKRLILKNKKTEVSKMLLYPLATDGINVGSQEDFLANYSKVISPEILKLLKCTTGTDIWKHNYRGHAISQGAIWMDGKYFGNIKPVLVEDNYEEYWQQQEAQLADKDNWHLRIYAIFPSAASCESGP